MEIIQIEMKSFAKLPFRSQMMALELAPETVAFLKKREWAIAQFMKSGLTLDQATKEIEDVLTCISATVNKVKGDIK